MRYDVKKYLFIGPENTLHSFFENAQEAGLIQFVNPSKLKPKEVSYDIQNLTQAIKILRELPTLKQEEPDSEKAITIAEQILKIKQSIERHEEELRIIRLEISRIEIFGRFSLTDIKYIEKEGNRVIQFFFSKKGALQKLPENLGYVASDHGLDYYISINKEPVQYDNLIEMKIDKELSELYNQVDELKKELHDEENKLKKFAKYKDFLNTSLIQEYNQFNLSTSKGYTSSQMEGRLFSVEGWVPVNRLNELKEAIAPVDVHMAEIALEPDETIPTYLENQGMNRVGEDLVHIYDTPSASDKDPSLWVLLSFAVFFAMIIGDGGYGLIFLGTALYLRYRKGLFKDSGRRFYKLALVLSLSCILWGVLSNSFFGISFGPESPVRKVSLINWLVEKRAAYHFEKRDAIYEEWTKKFPETAKATTPQEFLKAAAVKDEKKISYPMINQFTDSLMMELALLIGTIHVMLSLMRYLPRNWPAFGWLIAIVGAYLYLPHVLKATSLMHYVFGIDRENVAREALWMVYFGFGLAVLLALIKNKLPGLLEAMNAVQIFADIMSYLRLYALGMAGAIISATINEFASSLMFIGATLLYIAGHTLNIVLSIIGGVIHGLRLNFIEWYHYSFEGGGKLFNPLRKLQSKE